jgi:hypothetical protein
MIDNWSKLIEEYNDFIGMIYENEHTGELYRFFGLVHSDDDYYYGMYGIDGAGLQLLSCVSTPELMGFKLHKDYVEVTCPYCGKDTLKLETYSDRFGPKELEITDLQHYVCTAACINDHETPQQYRDRYSKILEAYEQIEKD